MKVYPSTISYPGVRTSLQLWSNKSYLLSHPVEAMDDPNWIKANLRVLIVALLFEDESTHSKLYAFEDEELRVFAQ